MNAGTLADGGLKRLRRIFPYLNTASEPHVPNISIGNAVTEDINFPPPTRSS
jgi:hypothetical protein